MQKGEIATFVILIGIAVLIAGIVMGNLMIRSNSQTVPDRTGVSATPTQTIPTTVPKSSTTTPTPTRTQRQISKTPTRQPLPTVKNSGITETEQVDLTIENISRSTAGYKIYYCNRGTEKTEEIFALELINIENNSTHRTTANLVIPAADSCTWSPAISCALIESTCNDMVRVRATIDPDDQTSELNETNNTHTGRFNAR